MKRAISVCLILSLFLLVGCDSIPGLPAMEVGEVRTKELVAPLGDAQSAEVTLRFGAASFHLQPGATELLEGKVDYNVDELEPEVKYSLEGEKALVEVGPKEEFKRIVTKKIRNDWDIRLSQEIPLSLRIEAGAFSGEFELGGLRLVSLAMRTGAASATVSFQEPNPEVLEEMEIETGASKFEFSLLGNANFERLDFEGGVGSYVFDFTGELQRPAEVRIETGVSQVTILVPQTTGARVIIEEQITETDIYGFRKVGEEYRNDAYEGAKNALTLRIRMGVGSLKLRSE